MDGDRDEQTTEVRETNEQQGNTNVTRQTVTRAESAGGSVVIRRIIYFIAGVIIAFLVLRIIFLLLAANQGSGFVDFIYGVGGFFAAPFYGIFNYTPSYGQFVFEISSVVAIIIYALVAWGLGKLLTLTSNRSDV
jgi:hypothetical protein